MGKRRETFKSF